LYLLLRLSPTPTSSLLAATYIPSRSPVRQKTLFASTRATLVRELGSEKFKDTIFLTEKEEVLDPKTWNEYTGEASSTHSTIGQEDRADTTRHTLLSTEERELQAVKRAEEEERHGTRGRDLMGAGGSGGVFLGGGDGTKGVSIPITDDARTALRNAAVKGSVVQLGIEIATETVTLLKAEENVDADAVMKGISIDRPSYTLYGTGKGVLFIYVCPGSSKVKERMVYASSRRSVQYIAKEEGVDVLKTLEAGDPEDLDGGRIRDEVNALGAEDGDESAPASGTATPTTAAGRGGFARPKRPGKR
jgi:twinfilin-like protein